MARIPTQTRVLELEGRSNKGKRLVKQFGHLWAVVRFREEVECFFGAPGLFIVPAGHPSDSLAMRWIKATTSGLAQSVDDFTVVSQGRGAARED